MSILITVLIVCALYFKPAHGFEWTDTLKSGSTLSACVGGYVVLDWKFQLGSGESVKKHRWAYQWLDLRNRKTGKQTNLGNNDPRLVYGPGARLTINFVSLNDSGLYTATVEVNTQDYPVAYMNKVYLHVTARPILRDGGKPKIRVLPTAVRASSSSQQWHVMLSCGTFTNLGHPPVTASWNTPFGRRFASTGTLNGTFYFALANPVVPGVYGCEVESFINKQGHRLVPCVNDISARYALLAEVKVTVREDAARNILLKSAVAADSTWCLRRGASDRSGIRVLTVNNKQIRVWCDQETDGGSWTVIQRHRDNRTSFNRNWTDYETGFGDLEHSFWLGLDNMHHIVWTQRYSLLVELTALNGSKAYARYNDFYVSGASHNYTLSVAGYNGTAGDSLIGSDASRRIMFSNGMQFSTADHDNDLVAIWNCGAWAKSGWWFNQCGFSNLNGRLGPWPGTEDPGVLWHSLRSRYDGLRSAEMKIRPQNYKPASR